MRQLPLVEIHFRRIWHRLFGHTGYSGHSSGGDGMFIICPCGEHLFVGEFTIAVSGATTLRWSNDDGKTWTEVEKPHAS